MSKELPFFKFHSAEWLTGDITLESYKIQGIFINICAEYWQKDCQLLTKKAQKKLKISKKDLETLIECGLIKSECDEISIDFLDEQYQELMENHSKRVVSGKKGGLKRVSNAQAMVKPALSNAQAPLKHLEVEEEVEIEEEIEKKENSLSPETIRFSQFETKAVIPIRDRKMVIDLIMQIPDELWEKFLSRCDDLQAEQEKDNLKRFGPEKLIKNAMQTIDQKQKPNDPIIGAIKKWADKQGGKQ